MNERNQNDNLYKDDNDNDNHDDEEKQDILVIGEKDDYVTDNSDDSGDDQSQQVKHKQKQQRQQAKQAKQAKQQQQGQKQGQVKRRRRRRKSRVVFYVDEGKLRKTPEYSKFAVILSAFFYAGFVILKQLNKAK